MMNATTDLLQLLAEAYVELPPPTAVYSSCAPCTYSSISRLRSGILASSVLYEYAALVGQSNVGSRATAALRSRCRRFRSRHPRPAQTHPDGNVLVVSRTGVQDLGLDQVLDQNHLNLSEMGAYGWKWAHIQFELSYMPQDHF